MVKSITIEGNIELATALQVADYVGETIEPMAVKVGNCTEFKRLLGAAETIALSAAIAALIQAIAMLWEVYDKRTEREKWSYAKVLSFVRNEMASRGIHEFSVKSIKGFHNLLVRNEEPCVLILYDKGNNLFFEFRMYADGNAYVFFAA